MVLLVNIHKQAYHNMQSISLVDLLCTMHKCTVTMSICMHWKWLKEAVSFTKMFFYISYDLINANIICLLLKKPVTTWRNQIHAVLLCMFNKITNRKYWQSLIACGVHEHNDNLFQKQVYLDRTRLHMHFFFKISSPWSSCIHT